MNKQNTNKKPGWQTANKNFYKSYSSIIRELKEKMTTAEMLLWERIRNNQLGAKFRRQHTIESYVPDFVALSIKLIIEVDGKIHLKKKREDKERTEYLELMGYKVIRFKNEEVESDIDMVVERIRIEIEHLAPPDLPEEWR